MDQPIHIVTVSFVVNLSEADAREYAESLQWMNPAELGQGIVADGTVMVRSIHTALPGDPGVTYTDNDGGPGRRIIATVQPQVWVGDYAYDNGPVIHLDVTDYVLGLTEDERANIHDNDYTTDELWTGSRAYAGRDDHGTPFSVWVRDSIDAYFATDGD